MREQTIEDEILGTLTWDDELEWWEGKQEITLGHSVSVFVSPNDEPSATVIEHARQVFVRVQKDELAFRRAAAERLLALHNKEWNNGSSVDADTFIRRISITECTVYYDGSTEISYADGDLFWGHTITVSLDKDGAVQDADING